MKAGRFRPADSLDLLLDTMCNTFGGISLIAILVALLTSQTASPLVPAERAQSEMIERRLATAEADLAAAQAMRRDLEGSVTPLAAARAIEKQRLSDALRAAQAESEQQTSAAAASAEMKAQDPARVLSDLAAKSAALERRAVALENAIAAQAANSDRLRSRLTDLASQIQKELDTRTRQVRLPKERGQSKRAYNVILRFGQAYPLASGRGVRNTRSITWISNRGGYEVRPIAGAGDDAASLQSVFKAVPGDEFYVAFYVYPDAFDAFAAARDTAVGAGLDYGLEIVKPGLTLSFGSDGTSPPPL